MRYRIMSLSCVVFLMIGGLSQAAEITLVSHRSTGSQLRDGMILATGRIICREIHTGFQIWMNDRQEGGHPRHYVIQNSKGNQGELRVRIGGNSWFSSLDEEGQGWIRLGKEKQVNFDVIVDGEQYIPPGKYIFSVSGKCMASEI